MSEFRLRPKDDYVLVTKWDKLFVLTQHWISDLRFYQDDLRFFKQLIKRYFIWINTDKHQREVEIILNAVNKLAHKAEDLIKKTSGHLGHIKDIIDEPFTHDSQKFREEHQDLEYEIAVFVKTCRDQRDQVFSVIEHVVDKERLQEM